MGRKKKPKITETQLSEIHQEFLQFCPKLHKVNYTCKYDSECLCAKCCIKFMVEHHGDLLGDNS